MVDCDGPGRLGTDSPRGRQDPRRSDRDLDVWLHFDAKYKLDWSSSQFERAASEREDQTALEDEEQERQGTSRRDDLLKMHAYRDAIRRSAGAYVLFPGTSEPRQFREYVELIPGLGAFPLRPGSDAGAAALRRFIGDVLLHAADQATAEERSRFWASRVFHGSSGSEAGRTVDFLDRPPADTARATRSRLRRTALAVDEGDPAVRGKPQRRRWKHHLPCGGARRSSDPAVRPRTGRDL